VGGELRLAVSPSAFAEFHFAAQVGSVQEAVSRADLEGRTITAGVIGAQISIPFGPLEFDWGLTEDHVNRFDVRFGPWF
jgi:outer membrane protein assembly factor BamA